MEYSTDHILPDLKLIFGKSQIFYCIQTFTLWILRSPPLPQPRQCHTIPQGPTHTLFMLNSLFYSLIQQAVCIPTFLCVAFIHNFCEAPLRTKPLDSE